MKSVLRCFYHRRSAIRRHGPIPIYGAFRSTYGIIVDFESHCTLDRRTVPDRCVIRFKIYYRTAAPKFPLSWGPTVSFPESLFVDARVEQRTRRTRVLSRLVRRGGPYSTVSQSPDPYFSSMVHAYPGRRNGRVRRELSSQSTYPSSRSRSRATSPSSSPSMPVSESSAVISRRCPRSNTCHGTFTSSSV